ncbi:hypothetical protein ABGB12_30070 [Actinocorallia sp. B10E7]|uniref:hypothetical protein n=1 Tax=Actinocorallia sp. B10E7 TaxID=3153558 RepID=UPI00325C4C7A
MPWIAYTMQSGAVMLAYRTATEWLREALPCEPAARDEYRISLSIDSKSRPHLAYQSRATDHLIYGVRDVNWQFEEANTEGGLFPGSVRFVIMKVCHGVFQNPPFKDIPHLCYQAGLSLWHASKAPPPTNPSAPPTWRKNVEKVDSSNLVEKGWFTALDFDSQEVLRTAYFDDRSPAGVTARQLRMATMIPGVDFPGQPNEWRVEILDRGDVLGECPAMAHSITGEGIISYFERKTRSLKICMFGNFPESPAIEVVSSDVSDVRSAVGVSHQSRFCIVYGAGGRLRYATRTGIGTFAVEDVEAGGGWPQLIFDSVGSAHVAHVVNGTLRYALAPQT